MYACIYVCMHVCMCACMYVCQCMYVCRYVGTLGFCHDAVIVDRPARPLRKLERLVQVVILVILALGKLMVVNRWLMASHMGSPGNTVGTIFLRFNRRISIRDLQGHLLAAWDFAVSAALWG